MSMMSTIQQQAQSDLALLRIYANPTDAAKFLEEIANRAGEIEAKIAANTQRETELNAQAASIAQQQAELTKALSAYQTDKAATEASLTARAADLAAREAVFEGDSKARLQKLATDTEAVRNRERAVEVRESRLGARENDVVAREEAIGAREDAAEKARKDHEDALAELAQIVARKPG